jgi:hypothetical protein
MDSDEVARLIVHNQELRAELVTAAQLVVDIRADLNAAEIALEGGPQGRGVYFGTILADTFYQMCLSAGAQNYVELHFKNEQGGMVLTAQRSDGISPGKLNTEARKIFSDLTQAFADGKDLHPYMLAAVAWLARTAQTSPKKDGE